MIEAFRRYFSQRGLQQGKEKATEVVIAAPQTCFIH
jgi:hypothetical protein